MQYGLKIIQGAYLSKVKEYEHEIREFKNHDTEKMLIVNEKPLYPQFLI